MHYIFSINLTTLEKQNRISEIAAVLMEFRSEIQAIEVNGAQMWMGLEKNLQIVGEILELCNNLLNNK